MRSILGIFFAGVVGCALGLPISFDVGTLPQVTTKQGTIVGTLAADGEYYEFYGIPYADSTSGSHRFKVMCSFSIFIVLDEDS